MNALKQATLIGVKLAIVTAALFVTLLAPGRNADAGSGIKVFFSYSSSAPIPAPAIIVNPGGDLRHVYVWATGITSSTTNSTGVSGFTLSLGFDEEKFAVIPASGDPNGIGEKDWLASSGRSASCVPEQGTPLPGRIVGLCTTLDDPPPFGATGNALLGHVRINPGMALYPSTPLQLIAPAESTIGTFLVDTPVDPDDIQELPATLIDSNVIFLNCADNSSPGGDGVGDNLIDLSNDILGVILRFQWNTATPGWHPAYDVNQDGVIDLSNDILGTILQFQLTCLNPNAK